MPYKFLQNEKRKDPLLVMVASKLNFVQPFGGRGQQVGRSGVLESQSSMWEAKALFILAVRVSGGDEIFFQNAVCFDVTIYDHNQKGLFLSFLYAKEFSWLQQEQARSSW